jgi:hypothetical protein
MVIEFLKAGGSMRKCWFAAMMIVFVLSGCTNKIPNPDYLKEVKNFRIPDFSKLEKKSSGEFNFILGFGDYARNIINTFDNTFTIDLVKGFSTIRFQLSEEEMILIEEKFRDIDILSYPAEFKPNPADPNGTITLVMPCSSYYLRIELDGEIREIFWKDEHSTKDQKSTALRDLIYEIEQMIYDREEYKKMPSAKGGYE